MILSGNPMSFPFAGGYGCNYTHFAPPKSEAEQFGVVYLYDKNRALIQNQLGQMRQNGQTCIKIPLYYWPAESAIPPYVPDGFLLGLYGNTFDSQRMQNVQSLFADINAAGFTYLEVSFLPAGGVLSPSDSAFDPNSWTRTALLIDAIRPLASGCGVPKVMFDLVGEGIPTNAQANLRTFSQTIWGWYTAGKFPNGAAVTDATISFVPTREIISNIPGVFQGNWPAQLQPHVYGAMYEDGWGSAYSVLCGVCDELDRIGAPAGIEIEVGETYAFRDLTTIAGLLRAAHDRPGHNIRRVLMWPMVRPSINDEQASPPLEGIPISGDPSA